MEGTADPAESIDNRRRIMPGFDGRGPEGMGSGTGRRMGYCFGGTGRGAGWNGFGHGRGAGGFNRGMGRGAGFGAGHRRGFGRSMYPSPADYYGAYRYEDVYPREDEMDMLKKEASFMEERLGEIKNRISEIESDDQKMTD